MGALKKAYHIVALVALLNLAVIGGLIGYLASDGTLSADRVEQIAAVLRGEQTKEPEVAEQVVEEVAGPSSSSVSINQEQAQEEMARLRADRRRAELNQQAATVAAARLEVTRQREALERRAEELASQADRRKKEEQSAGFKKELDVLASLKPKDAVFYLLKKEPEDAANMLLSMPTRKAKRIIEGAKTATQKRAMADILQMLREISPDEAKLLAAKDG